MADLLEIEIQVMRAFRDGCDKPLTKKARTCFRDAFEKTIARAIEDKHQEWHSNNERYVLQHSKEVGERALKNSAKEPKIRRKHLKKAIRRVVDEAPKKLKKLGYTQEQIELMAVFCEDY